MDKRTFLQTAAVLIGGGAVAPFWGCTPRVPARTNWAGNLTYSTDQLYRPKTVEEVQEVVRRAARVRPLGSRHCFNTIADSQHAQLSLELLPHEITFNEGTVSVPGSMRYGELIPFLNDQGVALHNLASLPHISVAGACATATHGSGITNGNLATAVQGMEIVNASGELVSLSRWAILQRNFGPGIQCQHFHRLANHRIYTDLDQGAGRPGYGAHRTGALRWATCRSKRSPGTGIVCGSMH